MTCASTSCAKIWLAHQLVAQRAVLVLTVLLGLAYPVTMTAVAQILGLRNQALGSIARRHASRQHADRQQFTDADGNPIPWYFQTRPSATGDGYDPTASSASNLGPEDVVDTLPSDPADPSSGQAEPAHPVLPAEQRGRHAGRGGRQPAVLHPRRRRRRARGRP